MKRTKKKTITNQNQDGLFDQQPLLDIEGQSYLVGNVQRWTQLGKSMPSTSILVNNGFHHLLE